MHQNLLEYAQQLDQVDPLRSFREKFHIPRFNGQEQIYFLGNSLGLQSKNTEQEIGTVMAQWANYGVEGFVKGTRPWMDYHRQLTTSLSSIVGALPEELTLMNQLTVNLHLMMISFYRPDGRRNKILCEAKAFPSDQYMLETHLRYRGLDPHDVIIEVKPRDGQYVISSEDILAAIDQHKHELALVFFSGVNYYSGQAFDINTITRAAHEAGIIAGFDLAHAAGNIPLQLHDWDVDFACWCSYKYLNAGPGAVGGVYVHQRFHTDKNIRRFAGWWGYEESTRFKMEKGFKPIPTAEGWQLSTPSLFLYACHKAALQVFGDAGWEKILSKKKLLNDYLWFILETINTSTSESVIKIITPRDGNQKGCQVSMLMLQRGKEIFGELGKQGVMADWREPDVIRIAPVPLYNRFEEVWRFGNIIGSILER